MDRAFAIRATALYVPAALAALPLAWRKPTPRELTAALLGCAWNLPTLLLVNVLALRLGWWTFAPQDATLLSVPAELLLGWVVLWGAVPALLLSRLRMGWVVAILLGVDLVAMPGMQPVVTLGPRWLVGEALAVIVALVPSLWLSRWTAQQTNVELRGAMQAVVLSAVLLWMLPQLIFENLHGSWSLLLQRWDWLGALPLQIVAIPALMGVAAVREFAQRGYGTPIPFDPPRRLVTSGPYAYVANPMQLSMTLVLLCWGGLLGSIWVTAAAVMALVYGLGLAAADEQADLSRRFGGAWVSYRRRVREWLPRWRPYHPREHTDNTGPGARLYVASSCGRCSEVARWFASRKPRGLAIVPAEEHPSRDLLRVTYDPGDGSPERTGVAAIASALEHIHLGWALVAWLIRVPGFTPVLQLVADASGGEAQRVRRSASAAAVCRT